MPPESCQKGTVANISTVFSKMDFSKSEADKCNVA